MPEDKELKADQTMVACCKDACDLKSTKCLDDDVMSHTLNLYRSSATPRDFEISAPNDSFEDPLTSAHRAE